MKSRERGQGPTDTTEVSDRTMGHLTQKNKNLLCFRRIQSRGYLFQYGVQL